MSERASTHIPTPAPIPLTLAQRLGASPVTKTSPISKGSTKTMEDGEIDVSRPSSPAIARVRPRAGSRVLFPRINRAFTPPRDSSDRSPIASTSNSTSAYGGNPPPGSFPQLLQRHPPTVSLQPLDRDRRSVQEVMPLLHRDLEHCVDYRVVPGISLQDHGSAISTEIGTGTGTGVVTIATGATHDPVAVIGLAGNKALLLFLEPFTWPTRAPSLLVLLCFVILSWP
jgi:hypothetical protein